MDSATADLICSLQLQDLADIQASRNRERPRANGDTNVGNDDAALALRLYCEELRANASVTADHHFGEAIGRAEDPDAMPETRQPSATPDSDSIFARSFAWLTCSDDDPASETPETTSDDETAASGDCIVCLDHYRDLMTAPCGDHYCKDDIMQLFDQSLTDESLFPPRCCRQAIPIDIARPFLTPAKADEFEAKSVELSIVNRTYCHDHSCAKFIPPTKIADHRAICDHCGQITCALCKLQAHDEDCPDDPAHQTFMAAAQAAGFQKCYQCKRMVELDFGCNHMTYARSKNLLGSANTCLVACAVQNFAMFAANAGKRASATSGMSSACSQEQNRSPNVLQQPMKLLTSDR